MSEKDKSVRPRPGYVMVELTPEERIKLEKLRDRKRAISGARIGLSATVRDLIREAK